MYISYMGELTVWIVVPTVAKYHLALFFATVLRIQRTWTLEICLGVPPTVYWSASILDRFWFLSLNSLYSGSGGTTSSSFLFFTLISPGGPEVCPSTLPNNNLLPTRNCSNHLFTFASPIPSWSSASFLSSVNPFPTITWIDFWAESILFKILHPEHKHSFNA